MRLKDAMRQMNTTSPTMSLSKLKKFMLMHTVDRIDEDEKKIYNTITRAPTPERLATW